jgi:hypothetical protein
MYVARRSEDAVLALLRPGVADMTLGTSRLPRTSTLCEILSASRFEHAPGSLDLLEASKRPVVTSSP